MEYTTIFVVVDISIIYFKYISLFKLNT